LCSVDSAEYPLPEPKITLQSIAQRWLNKLSNKEGFKGSVTIDPPVDSRTDEASAVPPQQTIESVQEMQHKEAVTSDPNISRESGRSEEAEVVLHSTPASGGTVSPMLPLSSQDANSTFTKLTTNSTFMKADESCTDMDSHTPQNATQLQIPSTKNTVNEVRGNTGAHCQLVVLLAFKVWQCGPHQGDL